MPKIITHDIQTAQRIDGPDGRYYLTPEGNKYPSVSAVASKLNEKEINEWVDSVGTEVAAKISSAAAARGTLIHEACEKYLIGQNYQWSRFHHNEREMFGYLLPVLNSVDEIHAMETKLYSDKLKVGGTVDLIAKIGDKLWVIDWKTSGRYKNKDDIHGYFIQAAAYAFMFWERTNIPVTNLKIAMAISDYGLKVFDEEIHYWLQNFISVRALYKEAQGI